MPTNGLVGKFPTSHPQLVSTGPSCSALSSTCSIPCGSTRTFWPQIRPQSWKWRTDRRGIFGIIWHATRSGIPGRTAAQEYQSAKWWFASPANRLAPQHGQPYAGIANYLIGGGRILRAVPEDLVPTHSAGMHDFAAISIEVAQATADEPFDPRDIALC